MAGFSQLPPVGTGVANNAEESGKSWLTLPLESSLAVGHHFWWQMVQKIKADFSEFVCVQCFYSYRSMLLEVSICASCIGIQGVRRGISGPGSPSTF